jgi:hypothetical protein
MGAASWVCDGAGALRHHVAGPGINLPYTFTRLMNFTKAAS